MNRSAIKKLILCLIHLVVLVVGSATALVLPRELSTGIIISVIFSAIAYLVFAASTLIPLFSTRDRAIQNGGLITASLIYLGVALVASIVLCMAHASTRVHVMIEIIVMALGIVLWAVMLLAKMHIDDQS